jgi:dienelactone hydrolase
MIARILTGAALMLAPIAVATAQPGVPAGMSPEAMAKMIPLPKIIAPPVDPDAIPLYGARTPGKAASENWSQGGDNVVVRNVTRPTLTPVLPDPARATGAAVIVAPGGGFMALSTETEGFQVARALAKNGIAAFVLKYRLVPTPAGEGESRLFSVRKLMAALGNPADGGESLRNPESTEDGLAALKLVRGDAAKWGVDPTRVGMIGFSAGAMTALKTALVADKTARPDFVGFVYGPQNHVAIPADAPALFDAIALDDPLFPSMGFPIVADWLKARRPVELHAYGRGGHGFGLGKPGTTPTLLMDEFVAWLAMQGVLQRK